MATQSLTPLVCHVRQMAEASALRQLTDRELLERFLSCEDQAAFTALVRRNGNLVLAACRQVLANPADIDDVFQATFLTLLRKATAILWQPSLGGWLFGTAHRIALQARANAQRRKQRESKAAAAREQNTAPAEADLSWREAVAVLHEELDRLPDRYRLPLLLCYLDGQSRDEVAERLGVMPNAVKWRLERGRELLRQRLVRRGITLSAGLLGAVANSSTAALVPPRLVQATLTAATSGPSATVAALTGGASAMLATKLKLVTALVLTLGLLGAGAWAFHTSDPASTAPPETKQTAGVENTPSTPPAVVEPASGEKDGPEQHTFTGRVLDPEGKPVAGARIYVLYYTPKELPIPSRGTSDKDGSFRFSVPWKDFDRSSSPRPWEESIVVAVADGYGLGVPVIQPGKPLSPTGWTLRLSKDDMPVTGRVLDLQGKPVAGATIRVHGIHWPYKSNDLTDWLARLKESKEGYTAIREHLMGLEGNWMGRDIGRIIPPAVTDAQGRFRLEGIGRERLVALRIEGPTIVFTELWAMTRPGEKIQTATWRRGELGPEMTFVGVNFEHVAAPCRPIVGVVRDRDTGAPLPGAIVESYSFQFGGINFAGQTHVRAVADQEGRYRLLGMPTGEGNQIRVRPPEGQPYLMSVARVPDGPALEPVTVDVELKRGVWITGKVTDKDTGKPVHSTIRYIVLPDNQFRKEAPGLTFDDQMQTRADDGSFRFVGLPGRGAVAARSWVQGYLTDVGADQIKGLENIRWASPFHTVVEVKPPKSAESVTCDLVLEQGRTLTGTILDPDGKPLAGVRVCGLRGPGDWEHAPEKTAQFQMLGLKPGESRLLQFLHKEKNLAGSLVVRADEKGPLQVQLVPGGVLTGRFVTTDGDALADLELLSLITEPVADPSIRPEVDLTVGSFPRGFRTDREGKFRIEGLAPGLKYRLSLFKGMYLLVPEGKVRNGVTVEAGETKDLGEIQVKLLDE